MGKIIIDIKKNVDNNFIVERYSLKSSCLSENSVCKYCCFYTGVKCYGHGDYWGTCNIYNSINKDYESFDNVVYDDTKCKVFKYLKSLESLN